MKAKCTQIVHMDFIFVKLLSMASFILGLQLLTTNGNGEENSRLNSYCLTRIQPFTSASKIGSNGER